jgi:AbrB family looped-hinge helix DNA binding protein
MKIAQSKVTAQGQISVPAAVRKRLGIGPGSILESDEQGDQVMVRRAGRLSSADVHKALFGAEKKKRTCAGREGRGSDLHPKKACAPLIPTRCCG